MTERQKKERIRFLTDRLELIYEEIKPRLKEFELTNEELNGLLNNDEANAQTE